MSASVNRLMSTSIGKRSFAGAFLRPERVLFVRPSAEMSFQSASESTEKRVPNCSRHAREHAADGRFTRARFVPPDC